MKILITGKDSYIGTSFEKWVAECNPQWQIDTVDTKGEEWKKLNFNGYDTVIHVAGIAHVSTDPKMEELYSKVNRNLALEVARKAKADGAKQIIFMSSMILYRADEGVGITNVITRQTEPKALNFYGDSKLQADLGIINKVLGNKIYDKKISDDFDYKYCVVDFEESIRKSIG